MPRNDRSDSLSVRSDDDPRRPLKAMQQEAELEFGWSETHDTGGVEHQSSAERDGETPARPRGEPDEPKEGGPSRAASQPPDRPETDAPLAPEKREEAED
jgi:hypothetical protein